ncbi:hypothetical protein [Vibrio crassostreae]|uniref:hypothetical protein n=1 Tax=Vibrio crassostreae TaxID=246167 RepID=UPI001B3002D8|nr:hypothetical protein [Vibrio crassostreae]
MANKNNFEPDKIFKSVIDALRGENLNQFDENHRINRVLFHLRDKFLSKIQISQKTQVDASQTLVIHSAAISVFNPQIKTFSPMSEAEVAILKEQLNDTEISLSSKGQALNDAVKALGLLELSELGQQDTQLTPASKAIPAPATLHEPVEKQDEPQIEPKVEEPVVAVDTKPELAPEPEPEPTPEPEVVPEPEPEPTPEPTESKEDKVQQVALSLAEDNKEKGKGKSTKKTGGEEVVTQKTIGKLFEAYSGKNLNPDIVLLSLKTGQRPQTLELLTKNQGYRLLHKVKNETPDYWRGKVIEHLEPHLDKLKKMTEEQVADVIKGLKLSRVTDLKSLDAFITKTDARGLNDALQKFESMK